MKPARDETAREAAHRIANELDASCSLHEELGWSHGIRCETIKEITEAAEARGFERGATWMREQAAKLVLEKLGVSYDDGEECAAGIRALPTVPK